MVVDSSVPSLRLRMKSSEPVTMPTEAESDAIRDPAQAAGSV